MCGLKAVPSVLLSNEVILEETYKNIMRVLLNIFPVAADKPSDVKTVIFNFIVARSVRFVETRANVKDCRCVSKTAVMVFLNGRGRDRKIVSIADGPTYLTYP